MVQSQKDSFKKVTALHCHARLTVQNVIKLDTRSWSRKNPSDSNSFLKFLTHATPTLQPSPMHKLNKDISLIANAIFQNFS